MLHSISWKQFMEFIAWAGVVYYLWVGVRYYRQDIVALLTGKQARKDITERGDRATGDRVAGDRGESDGINKNKNI
jgi:hypothetical protein